MPCHGFFDWASLFEGDCPRRDGPARREHFGMRMIHSRRKRVKPGRQNGVILEVGNSGPTFFVVIVMVSSQDVLDRISNLAEDMLKSMGMELVEAQYRREKKGFVLRLFIDRLPEFAGPLNELSGDSPSGSGVTLDDCVEVSRQFGRLLDVRGHYSGELQFGSEFAGIGSPLDSAGAFYAFCRPGCSGPGDI